MERDTTKKKVEKKGKDATLEVLSKDFNELKQIKAQEFERWKN